MGKIYKSESAALRRVNVLIRQGIWPAVRHTDAGYILTHDPGHEDDE